MADMSWMTLHGVVHRAINAISVLSAAAVASIAFRIEYRDYPLEPVIPAILSLGWIKTEGPVLVVQIARGVVWVVTLDSAGPVIEVTVARNGDGTISVGDHVVDGGSGVELVAKPGKGILNVLLEIGGIDVGP